MKQLINLKFLGALSLISVLMVSCLKDEGYDNGEYGLGQIEGKELITLPLGMNAVNAVALELKDEMQHVELLNANYDFVNTAPQDITVTLEKNNALIPATGYEILPTTVYTIPTLDLVIPKGQRLSTALEMNVNTGTLDANKAYAIGFSIKSVSKSGVTIASNLRNVLIAISLKNKYDGKYSIVSGSVQRYTAPGTPESGPLNGSIVGNPDVTLTTQGPNSVEITGLQWAYGSNSGVGGINNLRMAVDPVTNLVTMTALGNATLANWAGHENRYDPATKTFYIAFRWNPATTPREYEMVITYKGPR